MSARAEVRRLLDGTEPEPASVNGAARTTFETLFGFPIVKPVRWSQTLTTAIQVEGPNGEVIRWERQMDLATPKLLVLPVVSAGLHKNGKLPKQDLAVAIYAEIIGRCEAVEAADNAGEAAAWGEAVLNAAPEVQDISTFDAVQVWIAWRAMQAAPQMSRSDLVSWMPPVISDGQFEYIRQSDVTAWVRQIERQTSREADLKARMAEAGWAYHFVQMWQPDVSRSDGAIRAVVRTFRRRIES